MSDLARARWIWRGPLFIGWTWVIYYDDRIESGWCLTRLAARRAAGLTVQ